MSLIWRLYAESYEEDMRPERGDYHVFFALRLYPVQSTGYGWSLQPA